MKHVRDIAIVVTALAILTVIAVLGGIGAGAFTGLLVRAFKFGFNITS